MKLTLVSLFCLTILTFQQVKAQEETKEMTMKTNDSKYPEALQKIFKAHGGLSAWKSKRTLSFDIPKPDKTEKHTIDLYSRDEKITMPGITMGSDGSEIWLDDAKGAYKGSAVFYHNLMFYFYAMPFVLADDGINYSETEALKFEGTSYPGIRISYDDGVGVSSKDEYFIHYNPETFQMEWLGYTVTFRSGEKSDNVKWIRYNDWMNVEGVTLPKSITWYAYEGRTIKEAKRPVAFENVTLSEAAQSEGFYAMPEGGKVVNAKK